MPTSRAKDLADFIAKQSTDDDAILETGALQLPAGTTAERPTAVAGMIRYNSTLGKAEQYDGVSWQAIDSPPTITSVSPDNFDTAGDSITITGSNFSSDCSVTFINNSGSSFAAASLTRTSSSSLSATVSSSMVSDDDDPYDVKVTNGSGLAATLENALDFAPEPAFTVASGSLSTIYDSARSSISITTGATSTESDATITYALGSGDSLPAGLSLASSTGTITGTATAVGSDTTTTFDIVATATDSDSNVTTNTREYSITVKAPVITSYTSTGSGTFSVPSGLTAVDVLVVAGGGSGPKIHGGTVSGGAGAGGLIYRPAFPVTPGGSVSYTVGDGAKPGQTSAPPSTEYDGSRGQNSTFGSLTAIGGGGGPGSGPLPSASPGGSGGGGGCGGGTGPFPGGTGTQPQQPGDSGQSQYGFGNPGGTSSNSPSYGGGGGGGAGGVGQSGTQTPSSQAGGDGGIGKQYDISGSQVYYAGGGGGNSNNPGTSGVGGQGGGGNATWSGTAQSGQANRGGGGGASSQSGTGSNGGSGIVIISY